MAGPIKISVLADVGQAVKSVTKFSDTVDEETHRVVTSLGDSKLTEGWGKLQEGFDVADTRAMGFRDTITGVQDTMTGFQGMMGNRKPGQTFADSMFQAGQGVGDLASGFANFLIPMMAVASSGTKAMAVAQGALNFVMSINPVFLVVAAIVALVVILVVAYNKSETFRRIVNALGGALLGAARAVGQFVMKSIGFIATLPGRITGIFSNAKNMLFNIGQWIITGLWNGLQSIWNNVIGWVSDKINSLPSIAKSILGIASPSKVFHQIGVHTMEGLHAGLESQYGTVTDSLGGFTTGLIGAGTGSVNLTGSGGPGAARLEWGGGPGDELGQAIWAYFRKNVRVVGGGNVQAALGRG